MKLRTLQFVLVAVLVILLGSLALACGGSDDDNGNGGETVALDTYFERVKGIMDGASESSDDIESEMGDRIDAATDIEDILDRLAQGLEKFQRLAERVRDDLNDISPPSEVEDQHREFTALYSTTVSALGELVAEVNDIDSDADDEVILEQVTDFGTRVETAFSSLGTQGDLSCFELQGIADENEIDIDLECGD